MELSSFADVPGSRHGKDVLVAVDQQQPFQKTPALIVQKVFIPAVLHELGYDHNNAAIRVLFRKIEYELNDRDDDEAVRRRQEFQPWRLLTGSAESLHNIALPVLVKQFRVLLWVDVQRDHFRGQVSGEFDALPRNVAPAVDGDNGDRWPARIWQVDRNPGGGEDPYSMVVAADRAEQNNR